MSPLESQRTTLVERLRDIAYERAGGHTSDKTYDPELLDVMTSAADSIEALEAELAAEREERKFAEDHHYKMYSQDLGIAHCVADELRAEVAALRKDAERYRFLRSNCECMGERPDDAIDAAIQQQKNNT